MKYIQVILIALITFTGCAKNSVKPNFVPQLDTSKTATMPDHPPVTYLALGDSYTIGEAVPQIQSFPYQLTSFLNLFKLNVRNPDIIAVTGWTTDNLINAIDASSFKNNKYDFVTLLIGVNDQYQRLSKDNYRIKFAQALQTAIAFAQGDTNRVFVLSIPDWGVTPFGNDQDSVIGPDIDAFNTINREETAKAHVPNYINITDISRQAATDPSLIAIDGLHPSDKMYGLWVQALEPSVKQLLEK